MTTAALSFRTPDRVEPSAARLPDARRGRWRSPDPALLAALGLAILLTLAWTVRNRTQLAILRLPDNDDMMRLAQVRDWLGGQSFDDLSQHRLGPVGGASMHWSRIADLLAAALVLALRPVFGQHGAELAMVVIHPAILFFAYLAMLARIAGRLGGGRARMPAVVLGALAFPTISLFVPGRIDHHALQIVLSLVLIDALVTRAVPGRALRNGVAGGLAAALSLATGLETAPEIVAVIGVLGLLWMTGALEEDHRMIAFGVTLGVVTLALLAWARPMIWPEQWCDGFTPNATRATLLLSGALAMLGVGGRWLRSWPARLAAAVMVSGATAVTAFTVSPVCFRGPYGALDPYLQRAWMSNVAEARGLFYPSVLSTSVIAFGGLCFASLAAVLVLLRDPAQRVRWWPMALMILLGTVASMMQVRVTYIMAGVATLPFAVLLGRPDMTDRLGRRLLLWLAGCGLVWSQSASVLSAVRMTPTRIRDRQLGVACSDGRVLRRLAALPPGTVMVPLDTAAYVIGMTPHRSVAAPYHRNNAGNLAMYRFFLSPPGRAAAIARNWRVDYVVTCPTSLDQVEVEPERPGSLIDLLAKGRAPGWMSPITTDPADMMIYRIRAQPKAGGTANDALRDRAVAP